MYLDTGRIERNGLDFDAYSMRLLHFLKTRSMTPDFGHRFIGLQHIQVGQADFATLGRKAMLDMGELVLRNFHACIFLQCESLSQ